jgi:molybdate transport repressor ModE-like protein
MLKMSIRPQWQLGKKSGDREPLSRLLELLAATEKERNLAGAARNLGISYRHAWGLIRQGNEAFGAQLLNMSRGRGSTLTAMGRKLLWADKRIAARLAPILDSLASELEVEIDHALSNPTKPVLRMHASHGFALELLRDFLVSQQILVDLKYRGSMEGLASLAAGNCDLAGFHAPIGNLQGAALKFYVKYLKPRSQTLISLATRRQGIMFMPGNPLGITSVEDLLRPEVRFVNRQYGSGTRILLDLLLAERGLDGRKISGYQSGEFTHAGVAAYIASGMADAGLGVETAARKYGLEFLPIVSERYFLICANESLDSPLVSPVIDILKSNQYRAAAADFAGIDVTGAGTLVQTEEAFPELVSLAKEAASRKPVAQR